MRGAIDITCKDAVQIIEVAPRDGFQAVKQIIPTETKIKTITDLYATGFKRMEIGAFVSPKAIPQMADIRDIIPAIPPETLAGAAVLIPNTKGAELALQAGITNLVYVISVSESHNQHNVRRSTDESFADFANLLSSIDRTKVRLRLDLATSFDCPFEGRTEQYKVIAAAKRAKKLAADIEIGICDTTGRATPDHVFQLFSALREQVDQDPASWAFHGHDTFGMGVANAVHAYYAGIRTIETAAAGLGGCPFAPGAKGNTATEDLVYTFHKMGIATGIDLAALLATSDEIYAIDPPSAGGRIRTLPREHVFA